MSRDLPDKAYEAMYDFLDDPNEVVRATMAVYPIIRDDVIAEVAAALRNVNWHNDDWNEAADFIERTSSEDNRA